MIEVLAFLKAIPVMVSLFKEVWVFFKGLAKDDPKALMGEITEVLGQLNNAKTPKERLALAESIQKIIARL